MMKRVTVPLMWKWSLRDLRERWLQVFGIAVIIGLGVAVYSGLGSATPWRTKQLDESYAILNMYDLRMELTPGSYLKAESLADAITSIPHASEIEDVELRLVFPTSVSATTPDKSVLVSGQVIGVDVTSGGPQINRLHVTSGRGMEPSDAGDPVAVIEHNFAAYYGLEPGGQPIRISGGYTLEAVGNAISPEHFMVVDEEYGVFGSLAQDRFAALFVPMGTAQEIAGLPDQVNEALITVVGGLGRADLNQLERELKAAMDGAFPQLTIDVEKPSENTVYRLLYDDIPGDQQIYDTFSFILLLGAAFGAFILIGRIVDAQRREIGINMALGVSPRHIARRYLLISAEIAFLGVAVGAVLGLIINRPLGRLIGEMLPTPYFASPFQPDVFLRAALIGIIVPFLAVIYPIWRAVRVPPIDAIQTGYLVSKGGGLAPWLSRFPLPGSSFTHYPLRSLSRGVRRTIMTVLGLSMAVVVLIAVLGVINTFNGTMDAGEQEAAQGAPDRLLALLEGFSPLSGSHISELTSDERIVQAVPSIVLPGQLVGDETFDILLQFLDLDNELWTPTIVQSAASFEGAAPGVLITEKAARDLGVSVGDSVKLNHLYRESDSAWRLAQTPVQVMGIHRDILRTVVYMDVQDAGILNLEGVANGLHLNPAPGTDVESLHQDLSRIKGVATVRRAAAITEGARAVLEQFSGVFVVIELLVLLMAFLIAANTTRTNMEERRRELATMFAFGTPVRTVLRMAMVESFIIGVLGTTVGIALGWLVMRTMILVRFGTMAPELSPVITVSPNTLVLAVLIGVVVVSLTPLLMARRLVQMDIPSTLRVVE